MTMHDPGLNAELPAGPDSGSDPGLGSGGFGGRDAAELYRIQTEDAWGRWIWLVAELIPHSARSWTFLD